MDNIFGDRFLGRQPAWHWLGTVIERELQLDPLQALTLAGADYEIRTTKVVTEAFGKRIDTGRVAIVRQPLDDDPEPRVLGVATKAYKPIQNRQLMELLAPIADQYNWPIETVGVLGKGEKFFATLQAGEIEIPGDTSPVSLFYLLTSGHDGGSAVKIATTPVRVVCQNTLLMGLQAANITASVAHQGEALNEVKFNIDVVAQLQASAEAVTAAMRLMAAAPTTADQRDDILRAAYPVADDPANVARARTFLESTVTLTDERRKQLETKVSRFEGQVKLVDQYRLAAFDRLQVFNDEHPAVADTPWAVYNAIVETEQYRRGRSDISAAKEFMFSGGRGQWVVAAFNTAYAIAKASS